MGHQQHPGAVRPQRRMVRAAPPATEILERARAEWAARLQGEEHWHDPLRFLPGSGRTCP